MTALGPDRFPDFFRAVHGEDHDPFPWQTRLAKMVIETGCWPPLSRSTDRRREDGGNRYRGVSSRV